MYILNCLWLLLVCGSHVSLHFGFSPRLLPERSILIVKTSLSSLGNTTLFSSGIPRLNSSTNSALRILILRWRCFVYVSSWLWDGLLTRRTIFIKIWTRSSNWYSTFLRHWISLLIELTRFLFTFDTSFSVAKRYFFTIVDYISFIFRLVKYIITTS